MKKTVAGLFAAVLTTAGLAVVSAGTPAQASVPAVAPSAKAPARAKVCYPGDVDTTTIVIAPNRRFKGQRTVVRIKVQPSAGSGSPTGAIRVRVRRNGQIIRERSRAYPGNPINVVFPGPTKLGTYNVFARYIPRRCTVYKTSLGSDSFEVVPRR